ncbi:MAG: GGDEF domain-containing protein [Thermomicrobiales bacterium]
MNLVGDPGTTELGYALLLLGTLLLAIVFAIQTAILSRRLRQREAHGRLMEELAFFDPLTRLPNRRLLGDRLQHALYASERYNQGTAVYFVDLNSFKEINDRFGHEVGDSVLAELARRWQAELRATDTLARWGGDEFVVVTEGITSIADIQSVIARLQHVVDAPMVLNDHEVEITMSLGVAVGCRGMEQPEDLIRCADVAMYRAKRSGRSDDYEIVGKPACIERIAGLSVEADARSASDSEYVRALA